MEGAIKRYGRLTQEITERLRHELDIINRLGYEDYFLLVWDIVRMPDLKASAMRAGVQRQIQPSLTAGITEVDAIARNLLFERFPARKGPKNPYRPGF